MRYLLLGEADGGHVIVRAWRLPDARWVAAGVDRLEIALGRPDAGLSVTPLTPPASPRVVVSGPGVGPSFAGWLAGLCGGPVTTTWAP